MRIRTPSTTELRQLARQAEEAFDQGVDEARAWLVSEQGRRYRSLVARALVLAAPAILRHPFFKTPFGKVVELAGGAALLIKVADLIRDWEPLPSAAVASYGEHPAPDRRR
jgi:hypothetical protein